MRPTLPHRLTPAERPWPTHATAVRPTALHPCFLHPFPGGLPHGRLPLPPNRTGRLLPRCRSRPGSPRTRPAHLVGPDTTGAGRRPRPGLPRHHLGTRTALPPAARRLRPTTPL